MYALASAQQEQNRIIQAIPDHIADEDIPQTAFAPEPKPYDKHACPKCGRSVRQGMFMHRRHCKGK